ncbi:MAG TPA: site-specific integrase [Woeseiaceae bacterium]|nr:site-specific integrase [Woeseiaceae bacterium]
MAKKITEAKIRSLKANPPARRTSLQEDGLRVEANPSGNVVFFAPYYQHGQKNKQKLGTYPALSVADARKAVLNLRHQLEVQDVTIKQSTVTFKAFVDGDFKTWCIAERKDGDATIKRLTHQFARHKIGRTKLKDVTTHMVDLYKGEAMKKYAPATVKRHMGDLSRVFSKAVEWEMLKKNPVSAVSRPRIDKKKTRLYLTEEELKSLSDALNSWESMALFGTTEQKRTHPTYLPYIVRVAVNTGMRRGEIMSLRWSDLDEKERIITVRGTNSKSATTRRIPISEKLADQLVTWNTVSGREHQSGKDYVFPVRSFKRSWESFRKLAGLKHVVFHQLRHNFASQLVLRGTAISVVSELMGHTDIKTTAIYLSVREDEKFKAVELL